jgi:hypothetical protein
VAEPGVSLTLELELANCQLVTLSGSLGPPPVSPVACLTVGEDKTPAAMAYLSMAELGSLVRTGLAILAQAGVQLRPFEV